MKTKIYVGRTNRGTRQIFKAETEPTQASHGHLFTSVMGPFRTMRAAQFQALFGTPNNPHLQTVSDAERIAKQSA